MLPNGAAALTTPQLLRNAALLHFCGSRALVRVGSAVLRAASAAPTLGWPALAAARLSVFKQFAAGEDRAAVSDVAERLARSGVRCIVDHSTEESEEPSARQTNLSSKLALLEQLSEELPGACAFVPVKLTGLVDPLLLERITEAATAPGVSARDHLSREDGHLSRVAAHMTTVDQEAVAQSLSTLRALCEGARASGIPLLLDAEQTHRQRAIDLLARDLSSEFNRPGAPPLVYNTYQAYLSGARDRLGEELRHGRAGGYTVAAKLVRGAYRSAEATRDASVLQVPRGRVGRGAAASIWPHAAAMQPPCSRHAAAMQRPWDRLGDRLETALRPP